MNETPVRGVVCIGCNGPIFALADEPGRREGLAECRNADCPKTIYLIRTGSVNEELRCRLCGGRDFGHHKGVLGPIKVYCVPFPNHHLIIPPAFLRTPARSMTAQP